MLPSILVGPLMIQILKPILAIVGDLYPVPYPSSGEKWREGEMRLLARPHL
ncbi:MAG TPA: hypothetical protein VN280_11435 [Variovorax sp.]|nr:hypothetical protein [Variovorax sp.]